jgi:hypothetical protein
MAESRDRQWQRVVVGIHCCGGLSYDRILGAQNFGAVELLDISIL